MTLQILVIMFIHPFTALLSGPTSCGKTVFTFKIITHAKKLIDPPPEEIIWCYGIYQKIFENYKHVQFHEGLPNVSEFTGKKRVLLIIDDLMNQANDSISQLFTRGSHHLNISVMFLTQNLFFDSKHNRTMNLNTHYLILFKNPRDLSQINYLARQMHSKHLVQAFKDATSRPYGYLIVDLRSTTDDDVRLRTGIFPGELPYAYIENI